MKFIEGAIVKSIAGHDKGSFHIIVKVENNFAWICDGKHRPLQRMKKKKEMHLKVTNTVVSLDLITNKKIRKELRAFINKS